ncbi:MAG: tetratricopeptide repeat protein [Candidatus Omnitrophica bacterium]|nr:tetratricopeptide repeat protein [Candidatus Omnitrophota bacterium]
MSSVIRVAILLIAAFPFQSCSHFWMTPDQKGQVLMNRGEFKKAAEIFRDPYRRGVAWFRAGEFEKAEQDFARIATPQAEYNRGNCLVMRGKYDQAVERYDRALKLKPEFEDAKKNRAIAVARSKLINKKGGDAGDQRLGADKIVFDKDKKSGGQKTEIQKNQLMSAAAMQAMWLRKVQTKPEDFLRAKFAYQEANPESEETRK